MRTLILGLILSAAAWAQCGPNGHTIILSGIKVCAPNATISGGGASVATFLLCAGPCTASETSNWKWTAVKAATVTGCIVDAQTYPTGAALTVDVLKNGTTTIFTSTVPTLAAGSSAYNEQTGMAAAATLAKGDFLLAKALTVGSIVAGQFVNVVCTVTY